METKHRRALPYLILVLVVALFAPNAFADCVSGTVTAEFQTSGPYAGLYKYTAVLSWSTSKGLSNVTMDCGFGQCPELSCAQTFLFDSPAAQSDGEPEGCVANYVGEFNCNGNPSIGMTDPIIKWDALNDGCEPGKTGTGTFCFYTNLGPDPQAQAPIFLIKNGQNVCQGTLSGDCPAPPCTVPTEEVNWGRLKARFR